MKLQLYILILFLMSTYVLKSQRLYVEAYEDITLSDGLKIRVHEKWGHSNDANQYYYEPVNLRFSITKNEDPEFSFLAYKDGHDTSGAIMHFLISWGLTKNQLNEAQDSLVQAKGINAKIMGAVLPKVVNAEIGFTIEGKSSLAQILKRALVSVGKTPTMPNTKIAASFQFNKEDAEIFQNALNENGDELKDVSISIPYILNFRKKENNMYCRREHKLQKNIYKLLNQIL